MQHETKTTILVVDDDPKMIELVKSHLEKSGYAVETAADGVSGLALATRTTPDLVVLDIALDNSQIPANWSMDGIDVLRRLRDSVDVPVVMLSATNISSVKVMALAMGADDYLPKPFDLHELSARIEAVLRRTRQDRPGQKILTFDRLRLDPGERRVWKDNTLVELTSVEFDVLYTLARRPNHVFTREKLLDLAWKDAQCSIPKVVDVHVGHIRKKIEDDAAHPVFIVTVRGTGYRFENAPALT